MIDVDGNGYLEVVDEARDVPRLQHEVQASGQFTDEVIEYVAALLNDFRSIALHAGADEIVGVATAAVRNATNGADLLARVYEQTGIALRVVSGQEEAGLAMIGAIHSLPVDSGMVLDVGGGSAQIARFRDREPVAAWTLPLGALRLTEQFLPGDQPSTRELRAIRKYVADQMAAAAIPVLGDDEQLVGTGGTIRNLAKIDRSRRAYPLPRMHGYELTATRLAAVGDLVRARPLAQRTAIKGLNEDRADIIVAGALATQVIVESLAAPAILVSGQGLREGIALAACAETLPAAAEVRAEAIRGALERFVPARIEIGFRRARIATVLAQAAGLDAEPAEAGTALAAAAALLDLGRQIDYYSYHRHTEELIFSHGLAGFSHRDHALIAAIVRQTEDEKHDLTAYTPLLRRDDQRFTARASAVLALADLIAQRAGADEAGEVRCERLDDTVVVHATLPGTRDGERVATRFQRVHGLRVVSAK